MPPTTDSTPRATTASEAAVLSACIPGLGQLVQGRFVAATLQFGTCAAYLVSSFGLGGRRALLLAFLWNVYSAYDAYRNDSD